MPDSVVRRARQVLSQLESDEPRPASAPNYFSSVDDNDMQLSFASNAGNEIVDELKTLDINTLTPIEAMSVLYKFVQKAKET